MPLKFQLDERGDKMSFNEISFPRYVYQQDSAPVGAINGAIWVDTNASPITTYVYNGSSWLSLTTDVDWIAKHLAQQDINILINSVAASSTLNDYDEVFVDIFSDADGASNTIDTGNTTAGFFTNKYKNYELAAEQTDVHGGTMVDGGAISPKQGIIGETNFGLSNIIITKSTSCNATHAYIESEDGLTEHEKVAFVGDVATFTYECANATKYRFVADKEGASYTRYMDGSMSYPIAQTNMDFTTGISGGESAAYVGNIVSIKSRSFTTPANKIIQTNAITIASGITGHQLYCKNATAGTGAVTYNLSADGGSTWDTAQALNSKNAFGATTGTSCILKINLSGTAAGNTAEASNYGIIIYT